MAAVELTSAADRRATIDNLFQLYVHDFSDFWPERPVDIGEDGRFPPYPWLEAYWEAPDRDAHLIRVNGVVAGFVLINRESHSGLPCDFNMAEFFVARPYRRAGVGLAAAQAAIAPRAGLWEIAVARRNTPALAFWRRVADGFGGAEELDQDDAHWNGMILRLAVA